MTADKVGPSGFAIDRNYIISDETMKACNPRFSQFTHEAQNQVKASFRKMGLLVEQPMQDEECLHYPSYFDATTGKFPSTRLQLIFIALCLIPLARRGTRGFIWQ